MSIPASARVYFHSYAYKSDNDPPLFSKSKNPSLRQTSEGFILSALKSSGVTESSTIGSLNSSLNTFITSMHSTNCYDTFIASLEQAKDDKGNVLPGGVHVKLRAKEKNWYKIHVGGDLKQVNKTI